MASKSIPTILVLLVICGVLPPSAISKRVPRVVDALNVILRLIFSITYFFTELWIPSKVVKYLSSTHSVKNCFFIIIIRLHTNLLGCRGFDPHYICSVPFAGNADHVFSIGQNLSLRIQLASSLVPSSAPRLRLRSSDYNLRSDLAKPFQFFAPFARSLLLFWLHKLCPCYYLADCPY